MGNAFSNRLQDIANTQKELEWEWNAFVESQQRATRKMKEIEKILKKIKGEDIKNVRH